MNGGMAENSAQTYFAVCRQASNETGGKECWDAWFVRACQHVAMSAGEVV